jgi:hypothetical protein
VNLLRVLLHVLLTAHVTNYFCEARCPVLHVVWLQLSSNMCKLCCAAVLCCVCCAAGQGATVIQLGGGTRELYYYPKNTMTVIIVGENVNKGKGPRAKSSQLMLCRQHVRHADSGSVLPLGGAKASAQRAAQMLLMLCICACFWLL